MACQPDETNYFCGRAKKTAMSKSFWDGRPVQVAFEFQPRED